MFLALQSHQAFAAPQLSCRLHPKAVLLLMIMLCLLPEAKSQPGTLDKTFGTSEGYSLAPFSQGGSFVDIGLNRDEHSKALLIFKKSSGSAGVAVYLAADPVLSIIGDTTCEPDPTLCLTNAADATQIEWYKDGKLLKTINRTSVSSGSRVAGGDGKGSGLERFDRPAGIYVDSEQNIYVADVNNHRIMKWAPNATQGEVVAGGNGSGESISTDKLNGPEGVFVDKAGNVFVADKRNDRIMKWAPKAKEGERVAGVLSVGNGLHQLDGPSSVFVDDEGAIYIADTDNHRIMKWLPNATQGAVVAGGNGPGSGLNQFNLPEALYVDRMGNIYVADTENHRIIKWAPKAQQGEVVAGKGQGGNNLDQLNRPVGVYVDHQDNIFISDLENHRVMKWAACADQGVIVAGISNEPGNDNERFNRPYGIQLDAKGDLYVADYTNNRVMKWGRNGINTTFTAEGAGTYMAKVKVGATTFSSNSLKVEGVQEAIAGISVTPSNTITVGTEVTFTASPVNEGTSPGYQWMINGTPVAGANAAIFKNSSLKDGDKVSYQLTSNAPCVAEPTVNSPSIIMTVNPLAISLSVVSAGDAAEPDEHSHFTISASEAPQNDLLITYKLSGTAGNNDYTTTLTKEEVILKEGQKQVQVPLQVKDDQEVEDDEQVILSLLAPTTEGVLLDEEKKKATLTIKDNDEAVISIVKGQDGSEPDQNGIFVMKSSNPIAQDILLGFEVEASSTAKEGNDYAVLKREVLLKSNTTEVSVIVDVENDEEQEKAETVVLSLLAPSLARVRLDESSKTATLLIEDDEEKQKVYVQVEKIKDAREDNEHGNFLFTLSQVLQEDLTIQFTLSSATAKEGTDYETLDKQVIIPAGKLSASLTIKVMADELIETDEVLELIMTTVDAEAVEIDAQKKSARLSILDNDQANLWVEKGKDAREDDQEGYFLIKSSHELPEAISISFALTGSASEKDYVVPAQPVVLPAGHKEVKVVIAVLHDDKVDENENIVLRLESISGSSRALIDNSRKEATILIIDNDACFNLTEVLEPASCQDKADGSILISLSGASDQLKYSWSNGSSEKDLKGVKAGSYTLTIEDVLKECSLSRSFTLTAEDKQAPEVRAKPLVLQLDAQGKASLQAAQLDGGSRDNCAIKSLMVNKSSFSCADIGQQQLTLTAEDLSGNKAAAQVMVQIEDGQGPQLQPGQSFRIREDAAVGTALGQLSISDNCVDTPKNWHIASGDARGQFSIDARGNLKTAAALDYEQQQSYSLMVALTEGSFSSSQSVVITVENIADKDPVAGAVLAGQQAREDEPFSFDIPDNAFVSDQLLVYSISGGTDWIRLEENKSLRGTPLNQHVGEQSISILATDSRGRSATQQLRLEVINTNDAPEALFLSSFSLEENMPEGTLIGELTHKDVDAADEHQYALVAGEGSTHNHYFKIADNSLLSAQSADFEKEQQLSIRLQVVDRAGAAFDEIFLIQVLDQDDGAAFLPNLFSPNGDQVNDRFVLHARKVEKLRWRIYNLQGRLLWQTEDWQLATTQGWDGRANGKDLPEGAYLWVLEAFYPDGSPLLINGKAFGNVTVVR